MSAIDSPRPSCSSSARSEQRLGPELGHPDAERDPGPGRGELEEERDAAAGERLGPGPLPAPRLQRGRPVEQGGELVAGELLAGEEVSGRRLTRRSRAAPLLRRLVQGGHSMGDGGPRPELEPVPRPRSPAGSGAGDLAIQAPAGDGAKPHPRPGEPRPARRVRSGARGGRLGRRAAAGVPAALGRAARGGHRLGRAPGAHLAQLARAAARPGGADQPGPGRLERGWLEPDPGPRARLPNGPSSSSPRARGPSAG